MTQLMIGDSVVFKGVVMRITALYRYEESIGVAKLRNSYGHSFFVDESRIEYVRDGQGIYRSREES